jgi:hypothetical protein
MLATGLVVVFAAREQQLLHLEKVVHSHDATLTRGE